jgi:mevalonate kinase
MDFLIKMANIAYSSERKILGINCGEMDQYTYALGNILYINCSTEPIQPVYLKPKVSLPSVIGDTRQTKNTPMILSWLSKRFVKKDPLFIEGMKEIAKVVEEAREELSKEEPNLERVGELMNLNQYYLKNYLKVSGDCPVSPNRLDDLVNAALDTGALGAKLSGSGGGGAMVALCKPEDLINVAKAIRRAGEMYSLQRSPKRD